jgi:Protein phosphatase 2C
MLPYKVSSATIIGRNHILSQSNRQDSVVYRQFELEGKAYILGVLCDGCGSGENSEVGAVLTANFLINEATRQLHKQTFDLDKLYLKTVVFFNNLVNEICGEDVTAAGDFIQHKLMATALGCLISAEETLIFGAGDGIIAYNTKLNIRDEDNRPAYLAYHVLSAQAGICSTDQMHFAKIARLPTAEVERLALFSDGFELDLLPQVWGLTRHPRALQRQFNLWSRQKHFADDATAILIEKIEKVL